MISAKILALLVSFFILYPFSLHAAVVDRTVAVVNNEPITLSEVDEIGRTFFEQVRAKAPPEQLEAALAQARRTVIEKMIDKKLVSQEAKKINLQVSDAEVDAALEQLLAKNQSTKESFRNELQEMSMSEQQYREELREQILASKLINYQVRGKIVISDDKIRARAQGQSTPDYASAPGEKYQLAQIGAIWGRKNRDGGILSQAEAKARAEQLRQRAMQGADFAELAHSASDLPSAAEGGDLGSFTKQEMAPYLRAAVENLPPGSVSALIEYQQSYVFFKRIGAMLAQGPSRKEASDTEEALDPRLKEQIREKIYQEEAEAKLKEWLQQLRQHAYIKVF